MLPYRKPALLMGARLVASSVNPRCCTSAYKGTLSSEGDDGDGGDVEDGGEEEEGDGEEVDNLDE